MEIFCFDIALQQIVTKRYGGPGFLIHDSHLFDGVDERQVAGAHPSSDCLEPVLGTTRFLCCSGRPNDQIQVFDFVAG